jgi:hypothetical protein
VSNLSIICLTPSLLPLAAAGVFRAKGFLSFTQAPGAAYTLHLSGKQRIDCTTSSTAAAAGPYSNGSSSSGSQQVQLVLIGSHLEQLQQLATGLEGCLSSRCPGCCKQTPPPAHQEGIAAADSSSSSQGGCAAAQQLQQLLKGDPRLELVAHPAAAAAAAVPGLVSFSAVGSVLHGIDAHQVGYLQGVLCSCG